MGKYKAKFTDLEWAKRKFESIISKSYRLCYKLAVSKRKNIKVIEQEILNMENDFNNPQEAIKLKKKTKKGVTNEKQGVELILC
jgi:gamma-glutamylcysteine synthetase